MFIALLNLSNFKDMIIQKSDKGKSLVIVESHDYIKEMESILSDQNDFPKINLEKDISLNLAVNKEKHFDKTFKKFVESNSTI